MNDDIATTIDALTTDSMIKRNVEETKILGGGDKLGVRHDGDGLGRSWIVDAAEENGLSIVAEDEDENMLVFA